MEEGVETAPAPSFKNFDPLWLPAGSVRALISIVVTTTTCWMVVNGITVPDWFQLFFTGTVVIYFKTRVDANT